MILSCYANVISVDEAPCSGWYWLIISVDIEQHGSKDATLGKAIPLFPPPALFAIQFNIEASVFQKQLDQLCQMEVFRHVIQFAEESSVVDSVIGSCKINKHNTCWFIFLKAILKMLGQIKYLASTGFSRSEASLLLD